MQILYLHILYVLQGVSTTPFGGMCAAIENRSAQFPHTARPRCQHPSGRHTLDRLWLCRLATQAALCTIHAFTFDDCAGQGAAIRPELLRDSVAFETAVASPEVDWIRPEIASVNRPMRGIGARSNSIRFHRPAILKAAPMSLRSWAPIELSRSFFLTSVVNTGGRCVCGVAPEGCLQL